MPRKPDYRLLAMNKSTDEKRKVGAVWLNTDGSLSIALDPFTVLQSSPDLVLTIFPNDGGDNAPK